MPPEESKPLLQPIFQDTSLSILLPLHRISYSLGLDLEQISWPNELTQTKQLQINTEHGVLQFELFIDQAPVTCWQWTTQVLRGDHNQVMITGDYRYLHIPIDQPVYNIGERNALPVQKGSLLFDPTQFNAEVLIAMEDHPEDLGRFVVFGQLIDGEHLLRHLRPHEHITNMDIIPTGF